MIDSYSSVKPIWSLALKSLILAGLVTMAGCTVLKPVKDQTAYYRLSADIFEEASGPSLEGIAPHQILDLSFPDDVHSSKLMVIERGSRIKLYSQSRWLEPFDKSFQRSLDLNVRALLGQQYKDLRVSVDVLSFRVSESEIISKYAYRWAGSQDISGVGEARADWTAGQTMQSLVRGIDSVSAQMAEKIVQSVQVSE